MSVQRDRLLSLIEFCRESVGLRNKPVASVKSYHFALHEHEITGLPGIRLDVSSPENDDEIWLSVERLHEKKAPEVVCGVLRPWVKMAPETTEEPSLRESVDGAGLIAAGIYCSSLKAPEQGKLSIDPEATIQLSDYRQAAQVRVQFAIYVETEWRPWADEEMRRRKTVDLYSRLFKLKQDLEDGIAEAPLEFVWGMGVGVWKHDGTVVSYPLVTRLVEMSHDPVTAKMEVRPRDADACLEVDWYSSVDNPGVAATRKAADEFFGKVTTTFSPFDRSSFEPVLHAAVTNLAANGIYWPNEVPAEDRTLPKPDNKLKVTDTWVLFARPRTKNLLVQDLERLKKCVEEDETYPPAVSALITDPDTTSRDDEPFPAFRGVSGSYQSEPNMSGKKVRDLYFPKPYNDEQAKIVQQLEISAGVVVQGPPGTGKTHTIANIICHYLAEGKRVLVTSMRDPALAVLRDKLPEEIRPLAISLLTSEQQGMKQFEYAIQKIASEVQSLDRHSTERAIKQLEGSIDALHCKLAGIDRKINEWAKLNLAGITLEDEPPIDPLDAANEMIECAGQFEWLPDPLGIAPAFSPQFSDTDVVRLREARRILGQDIDYLDACLPQLVQFPDSETLLRVHQDMSQLEILKQGVVNGVVPALADSSKEALVLAQELLTHVERFYCLRDEVERAGVPWADVMRDQCGRSCNDDLVRMLDELGAELERADAEHRRFFERPVETPTGIELDVEIVEAVLNLSKGNGPFGLKGWFGKRAQKKQLDCIRVLGVPPAAPGDWNHVFEYLASQKHLRELALRWNALSHGMRLATVASDDPAGGLKASREYAAYRHIKEAVEVERTICIGTLRVFPNWAHAREATNLSQGLSELERALRHHMTKNRLANVWGEKERFRKVLEGCSGRVIENIHRFLSEKLGNPVTGDAVMQAAWSELMDKLRYVLGLQAYLRTVRDVCDKIEDSGAPQYAAALRQPLEGAIDGLLPDHWRKAWRLRRLATHLESIDTQDELKKLARDRREMENGLSRAYSDIIAKRTWLKLKERASPSIKAALQGYLSAIQKIGKGTGKRAVRYRKDARAAAKKADPAVPCWIMPHDRVSESLPAELGCFDLVVIDEASQSDLTALPSLLRAKKVLIVGDDRQVSPEAVALEEQKILSLMKGRFLANQVKIYRPQMSPERSIYELFKVVFASSFIQLKEHFRSVGPIIEYSKREFYDHKLRPLRLPKAARGLDPPLVDVLVLDGYRKDDVNLPEASFIVDEISRIVEDPSMGEVSIGVVSLLGNKQTLKVRDLLLSKIGLDKVQRHCIECGDARTFQGKERNIMFLSMVAAPNNLVVALTRDSFAQRFNVAASRAMDRMYLVRSVELEQLSEKDELRRNLIRHFETPFMNDESRVADLRELCESPFEKEVYDELVQRGYRVTPQVQAGHRRIDLVVEGHNEARLAIECDGDRYHGPDQWDDDMRRQRVLERAGWVFWRCFASRFVRCRKEVVGELLETLAERGIEPIGAEGAPRSVHTERRRVWSSCSELPNQDDLAEATVLADLCEPVADALAFAAPDAECSETEKWHREESALFAGPDSRVNPLGLRRSDGDAHWVRGNDDGQGDSMRSRVALECDSDDAPGTDRARISAKISSGATAFRDMDGREMPNPLVSVAGSSDNQTPAKLYPESHIVDGVEVLTIAQVAKRIGKTHSCVSLMAKRGEIPSCAIYGNILCVPASEVAGIPRRKRGRPLGAVGVAKRNRTT